MPEIDDSPTAQGAGHHRSALQTLGIRSFATSPYLARPLNPDEAQGRFDLLHDPKDLGYSAREHVFVRSEHRAVSTSGHAAASGGVDSSESNVERS